MRHFFLTLFSAAGLAVFAQNPDPVLMTINGKAVTRGEFEYSFNKNGNVEGAVEKKTVEEYVDMFINYKLKVAAAEEARMDTLTTFKTEFRQYRDMQLTPYLVDEAFIDSVAYSLYKRTADQLQGKDMLRVAHILIPVKQNASETEKKLASVKADSIHKALLAGADFAELAKKHSQDPGSATRGGELPLIGPGMTVKEFEDAAYALQNGQMSAPVLSSFGYHIIKMHERKQLERYEELKANIVASLKRQNIDDASAENKIRKMVAASNGRLTREAIMDSVLVANLGSNPELKYLVQEYHDGLLLYEVSKKEVWDLAANDQEGLAKWFKANKKKYAWDSPRFKGFVYQSKDASLNKRISSVLKKNADKDWKKVVKETFNKDSVVVRVSGPYLCKEGENAYIDHYVFGVEKAPSNAKYPYAGVVGKMQKKPKTYEDVRSLVVNDYQDFLEKAWVEELREKFTFEVNQEVLKTVNNH